MVFLQKAEYPDVPVIQPPQGVCLSPGGRGHHAGGWGHHAWGRGYFALCGFLLGHFIPISRYSVNCYVAFCFGPQ